jgi:hypothetical protein
MDPPIDGGGPEHRRDDCRLRAIPNEEVYLYVKRIDNRAVVRAEDPRARRQRARSMVMGLLAALVLVAGLAPAAYSRIEGRRISDLQQQHRDLLYKREELRLAEADLVRVDRLRTIAKEFGFVDPSPDSLEYLDGKTKAEARVLIPQEALPAASR